MSTPSPEPGTGTVGDAARTAPILPLIAIGIGAYLLWFGVRYWKGSGAAVWPSYPVRSVLEGKGVPANQQSATGASATLTAYEAQLATTITAAGGTPPGGKGGTGTGKGGKPGGKLPGGAGGTGGGTGGGGSPSPQPASGNVNRGKLLAAKYGWSSGPAWTALDKLWQAESGWSNTADTRKTGLDPPNAKTYAYGIPQARPATKLPKIGQPPELGGRSDPTAQIEWGLAYIRGRYVNPQGAWAHEQANGWY